MKPRMSNGKLMVTVILIGLAAVAVVGFGAYGIAKWNIASRERGVPRIEISMDAASKEVELEVGQAVVFVLPNGKEVAVWNEKPGRFDLPGPLGGNRMGYGERPFRQLDQFEEIRLPGGGTTRGESLSYIKPGPVFDGGSGKPSTYLLFVDGYRISLEQTALEPALGLRVGIEKASEVERLGPKEEIDHFLGLLKHADSGMRLQAVSGLAEGLIMGSTYAEARETEIVAAMKALEADPDEQVREQVSAKLAEAGDAGSILRRLESMAAKQEVDTDAAWSLGRNLRYPMNPAAIAPVYQRAVTLASSSRDSERVLGVAFLSGCPEEPTVGPVLRRALADPADAVRAAALKGLEQVYGDDAEAARKQTIAMLGDTSPEVLAAALESSIFVGKDRLLPFAEVEPFLGHADRRVRIAALRALRFAEEPAAERRLLEISRDEDAGIRAEAAEALAGSSSGDVSKRFAELLDDPDVTVRIRGIQGLDQGRAPGRARIIGERLLKETDPDVIRVGRAALESAE